MLLSGLALCFACAIPRTLPESDEDEPAQELSPNLPLLLALRDSIEDSDAAAARLILERLDQRELNPGEQKLVQGFRGVLRGRSLVSKLDIQLFLRVEEGRRRLYMSLANNAQEPLNLVFPPITLEYAYLALSAAGELNRNLASRLLHPLEDFDLGIGESKEVLLGDCPPLLTEGTLAIRDAWRVSIRSGKIRTPTGSFPAERLARPQISEDTRTLYLRGDPEEPEEFVALLDTVLRQKGAGAQELLDSAIRLDPRRRTELLPLLAEVLAPYSNPLEDKDGHLAGAVLAPLRWISPGVNVDSSLAAWSRWTTDWLRRSARLDRAKNRSGLVLP